jgi:hypothetical protein
MPAAWSFADRRFAHRTPLEATATVDHGLNSFASFRRHSNASGAVIPARRS